MAENTKEGVKKRKRKVIPLRDVLDIKETPFKQIPFAHVPLSPKSLSDLS
jgi:hypothetical protein